MSRLLSARNDPVWALLLSVSLHGLLLAWVGWQGRGAAPTPPPSPVVVVDLILPAAPPTPQTPPPKTPSPPTTPQVVAPTPPPPAVQAPTRGTAFLEAPPAPTETEWAQAASYTLKNSKRYRHTWGQQVRSMMGTAFEGPHQGAVRFRIEIAPNGRLVRLETLWSTSPEAERLARLAVQNMPPLPPTPTGLALVFEKTISFQPFVVDDTPVYKNDCLPDKPAFSNPYAWDGRSAQGPAVQPESAPLDPQALEACLKQLPTDTIEAETAHNRRQLEQGRSSKLGP